MIKMIGNKNDWKFVNKNDRNGAFPNKILN